jgi:hypothetical protein
MVDGQFTIPVQGNDTIEVRLDGYETREIKITSETYYQITLKHKSAPEPFLSFMRITY